MVSPPEHDLAPGMDRASLACSWPRVLWRLWTFSLGSEQTWSQFYPTPMGDSPLPTLSSQGKAGRGCWVGFEYTHSLGWIWPCPGDWCLVLITPS